MRDELMTIETATTKLVKLVSEYRDNLDQTLRVELVQFTTLFTKFLKDEDDR